MTNKINVLYIDDEPVNIMLFAVNLKNKFNIITGKSGLEGLDLLRQNPHINVVVSDMRMPGMNGIEFIKQAKQEFPENSYYIFSGFDKTPEIENAINTKLINQYFNKPINYREIEKTILNDML